MWVKRILPIPVLIVLILGACSGFPGGSEAALEEAAVQPKEKPGNQLPDQAQPTEVTMINLPDLGPAPEFNNDIWLNVDEPVTLASLRGKVVLLEFWTFG